MTPPPTAGCWVFGVWPWDRGLKVLICLTGVCQGPDKEILLYILDKSKKYCLDFFLHQKIEIPGEIAMCPGDEV